MPAIAALLVANRGEIARRVFATARRMGIATIAVYSQADAGAAHVRDADRALCIGPAPAVESYLAGDKIIAAAKEAGADAIHPGYGFLSENAAFAEAVIAAGLIWVGPPPAAIRAMGLKDAAKTLMAEADVPVTPGYLGEVQSEKRLAQEAARIGFPVLIKAVAGGGGKGMRRVDTAPEFSAALAAAKREAKAAFGDDRVLLETYVSRPRHIEVQIFADAHGNVVHLYERDCSLQRRHQKVIEEAPAPGMDEATRAHVTNAAVQAARAVGYCGAGTVEFIADSSDSLRADRIWFMEMNTRLQVEHPVTEMITGLDLVEWQLRVASGEKLPMQQDEIILRGHAMEARLYAEAPASAFLPSTGPLTRFHLPAGVRVDSGFEQGDNVSPYYDPMLAKLIAHAPTRAEAIAALAAACSGVEAWPVKTNAGFLARCLQDREFNAGDVDTGFIARNLDHLAKPLSPSAAACAAAAAVIAEETSAATLWRELSGFRLNAPVDASVRLFIGGESVDAQPSSTTGLSSLVDDDGVIVVFEGGEAFAFQTSPDVAAGVGAAGDGRIRAPMPGRVTQILLAEGQAVKTGQALLVMEAMKMEHILVAPFDGKLTNLSVRKGAEVAEGAPLAKVDPD